MLNSLDERLIALLRENARISTSEIARALSISRSTVQTRLQRLEKNNVIKGYTLVYGDEYANQLVSAHVLITVHQKLNVQTNRALYAIPQVKSLYAVSGEVDLIAILQTQTTAALSQVLDEIGNLEGVERTRSSLILETKFSR